MSRRVPLRRTYTPAYGIADAYGRRGGRLAGAGGQIVIDRHPGDVVGLAIVDPVSGARVELLTDRAQWRQLRDAMDDEAREYAAAVREARA